MIEQVGLFDAGNQAAKVEVWVDDSSAESRLTLSTW